MTTRKDLPHSYRVYRGVLILVVLALLGGFAVVLVETAPQLWEGVLAVIRGFHSGWSGLNWKPA
ncbi:hypothetical protein ACFORO_36205 [Amycolatopsis halotolerans]|uniref:Uncharacterized protein n=1 Tax=Amycolatopsis halotolerans TaxID=330083 RepID=A0ABV7QRF8_9PSEU